MIARHAGGKFAMLLPETNNEGAIAIAERALYAIDELPPWHGGGDGMRRVTVSVGGVTNVASSGFSQGPFASGVPGDLLIAVERAVRDAKSSGGHRAQFVDIADFSSPGTLAVREH
jgi:GGDEF domain-containing protein